MSSPARNALLREGSECTTPRTQIHWHEPKAGENAGLGNFKRPPMPYDRFMEAEGVPVYRGIGVRRVQDLPLAPWRRLGGRGSYIQLYGTEGLWGCYVVEVPAAARSTWSGISTKRYVLVIEGRGSTEVWQEGQTRRTPSSGSRLAVHDPAQRAPSHGQRRECAGAAAVRHHGAERDEPVRQRRNSSSTARSSSANRYSGAQTITSSRATTSSPIRCAAWRCGGRISFPTSSAASCRSTTAARPATAASSRTMAAAASISCSANTRPAAIPRRTSMHSAAVLICIKGKGYTYTWPEALGPTPWQRRQGRQGAAAGLRAGRHGLRRADERRLVSPAFRSQQRRACGYAAWHGAEQSAAPKGRPSPASS